MTVMIEEANARGIRQLSAQQKTELAEEVRDRILEAVSQNGGHLASNLGCVELTIALHSVLNLPTDKLIFDVGHQCYTHKLLTGRNERFDTIRKMDGISGFLRTEESEFDAVNSGHASDSLSLALGYARARDLQKQTNKIAVVLGDGAFGGGMCFEALNDAGQLPSQMLIVLNDNEMSISKNVGAFSMHLTRLRQSSRYHSFKQWVKRVLARMPGTGKLFYRILGWLKSFIKAILINNDMIFESLGAEYLGPIDGHNISEMERTFKSALSYDKPVIVHVLTRKGKGYEPAEKEPNRFHGISPFDLVSGLAKEESESCGKTAAKELCLMAEEDEKIVCISAAMLSGTGLDCFKQRYPERCFDVGIAEEHAAALAGGLALGGVKPYLALYSTFLQRAYDQMSINVCLNKAPVVLLVDRAGLNGEDGESHQGTFDVGLLRGIPGITVACPSSRNQLKQMLRLAKDSKMPYAIRYPKHLPENGCDAVISDGKWIDAASGKDICIIASGRMVNVAKEAIKLLSESGMSAGLIDACFIKPLDDEMLDSLASRYKAVITVEDNCKAGSLGEAVAERIGSKIKVVAMAVPDRFVPAGTVEQQLKMCGLDKLHIVEAAEKLYGELNESKSR